MTEKERNTYPKWIHCGLIERNASNHRKYVARGITDENEPFSLREVGNALNETVDIFIELEKENEKLKRENEYLQGQMDTQKLINKSLKINEEYNKKAIQKLTVQKLEIRKWINDKISYLEKKYEFGQTEYKGCPMHNIQFGINILKELLEYWEEQEND